MRIAVVGDVHLIWDERDVRALDAADYDLVLFVGDLAGYGADGAVTVARAIARLRTPALVMPGNHDAVTIAQLAAETFRTPRLARQALAIGMTTRVRQLASALGPVPLCGYSVHPFEQHALSVVAARPHSMGGQRVGFKRYLTARFGVRTLADSARRLCGLLESVPSHHRILVLAHCGPMGLGESRDAIYGCDFRPQHGDWGDPDLAEALAHARAHGKQVSAVLAGHMHHALRGGGERIWHLEHEGVHHVNAARVPRRRRGLRGEERHHVRLTLDERGVSVEAVWLPLPD
ncbi:MAG: metallophosphoesterase [Polyangiales bacterium]